MNSNQLSFMQHMFWGQKFVTATELFLDKNRHVTWKNCHCNMPSLHVLPRMYADLKLTNTSQVTCVLTCKPSASWWRVPCTGRQILYTLWNLEKSSSGKKGNKTPYMSQVDHQARASSYPSFGSIKWLGVFLLPPGWDAWLSQDYPQH